MQEKTAREIAEMLGAKLNIPGTMVSVHPHPTLGWTASVVARPGVMILAQNIVDEFAIDMRAEYRLRPD